MRISLPALATTILVTSCVVLPEAARSGNDGARYGIAPVDGGILRLDHRTGQVSSCQRHSGGWVCRMVSDERIALEDEIDRLQSENATLQKALVARNAALNGGGWNGQAAPQAGADGLSSDYGTSGIVTFVERIWRRLVQMIVHRQKDMRERS